MVSYTMKCAAMMSLALLLGGSLSCVGGEIAVAKKHHARGTFTVDVLPLTPAPADGLARYSMKKVLHGALEGTSTGEMFSGGDPNQGVAGYVAIEVVTGALQGKHGTFALPQMATMDRNGSHIRVVVVPGSGTGELKGIAGTFVILIAGDRHSYDLEYVLPIGK
jgi:Protein of unknown function (DUF3224)